MSLEPAVELLDHARRHRYAVGYFESWDLASLEGVVDAAERTDSPIIIGFNGEFLTRSDRVPSTRLEWYGTLGRAAAESAKVPCAVMFNECPVDAAVCRAVEIGFNLVMLADASDASANLVRRVADVVNVAHSHNAAVEAELGELPCGVAGSTHVKAALTDPLEAAAFVEATGVDMLAVSAGNVHILLEGRHTLDLEHLAAIRRTVDVPLVLHGGSGIADESLAQAIALGVAKVNYGTFLKQRCVAAIRQTLANIDANPHHVLGDGGKGDLAVIVRQTVRDAVHERIGLLGCCNQGRL